MKAIQYLTELEHNQSRINNLVQKDLLSLPEIILKLNKAAGLSIDWIIQNKRTLSISFDLENLILKTLRIVCTSSKPITLSNLVGQLRTSDCPEQISLIGELVLCMAEADLFDIHINTKGYVDIHPRYQCEQEILDEVHNKEHMPPMICEPSHLTNNKSSAYLTVNIDSLILQKGNHHEETIGLDSLNLFNKVPLELDEEMLAEPYEETELRLKTQAVEHQYLLEHGNKFYLPHKYDKRGRTYCVGYHTSYQSDEWHKAILNFHQKEIIGGF